MASESYIVDQFRKQRPAGTFFYKIPDGRVGGGAGFTQKKPFDAIYGCGWGTYAIEFKAKDGGKTFNLDRRVSDHQQTGVSSFDESGSRQRGIVVLAHKPSGCRTYEWYVFEDYSGQKMLNGGMTLETLYALLEDGF